MLNVLNDEMKEIEMMLNVKMMWRVLNLETIVHSLTWISYLPTF